MRSPSPSAALRANSELASIVGLDHLGQIWIKVLDSPHHEQAWVVHDLSHDMVERAITERDLVLVQRVACSEMPIVCALVHRRLQEKLSAAPQKSAGTLEAEALSLGGGRAKLFVKDNVLHIEANALTSRVRGRHRLVAGSLELG